MVDYETMKVLQQLCQYAEERSSGPDGWAAVVGPGPGGTMTKYKSVATALRQAIPALEEYQQLREILRQLEEDRVCNLDIITALREHCARQEKRIQELEEALKNSQRPRWF